MCARAAVSFVVSDIISRILRNVLRAKIKLGLVIFSSLLSCFISSCSRFTVILSCSTIEFAFYDKVCYKNKSLPISTLSTKEF